MRNKKWRILALVLVFLLAFSMLAGCKKNNKPKEEPVGNQAEQAEKEAQQAEKEAEQAEKEAEQAEKEAQQAEKEAEQVEKEAQQAEKEAEQAAELEEPAIDKDGSYFSKDEVALYIHTYGELPSNFITKDEARKLGWSGGNVEKVAPGKAIGGDHFGNYEGLLPKKKGRTYYECDIDTNGYKDRGSRRIIFSDDGLIYYTHNHYKSFELLYGEE